MKRRCTKFVLVLLGVMCILGGTASALAAVNLPVQPMYVGVTTVQPLLTIKSSGKAQCVDKIYVKSGYSANITWELQSKNNGAWITLATWYDSGSGTISLDRYRYVSHGYDYRLKTSFKVYNSSNVLVDDTYKCSSVISY